MREYTTEQLTAEMTALGHVFDKVELADPRSGTLLDAVTLSPAGPMPSLPNLQENGRGLGLMDKDKPTLQMCQAITVQGRPCVLCMYAATGTLGNDGRDEDSLRRAVSQYQDDMRRDYVTNAYNSRYLDNEYRPYAEQAAIAGKKVGVILARVNEYRDLAATHPAAADCCLNTAAGILQLAVGMDTEKAVLCRLKDGLFLIVTVDTPTRAVESTVREALESARKEFNISLSRRGTFMVDLAVAEWGETANWEQMISLAQQRLGC